MLDVALLDRLPDPAKLELISSLWKADIVRCQQYLDTSFEPYWCFHQNICGHALHNGGRRILVRTHQDIIDLTDRMISGETREALHNTWLSKATKNQHNDKASMVDAAIDLAASLLVMINFRNADYGYGGGQRLQWQKGSLRNCIETHFKPTLHLGHTGVKLSRIFNAQNLQRLAGVIIVPTANLIDHLRLIDDDTKVYIFHHAELLKLQDKSSLIAPEVVEETLRTLALLFPQSDTGVSNWCRRLPVFSSMDPKILYCGHLKTDDRQIENFVYWHDRLVVLKQVFDEATPRTLWQWWHDRRNGVQWWTFWVAIVVLALTLLLGFIQCITGIMQVYAAFNPKTER